MTADPERLREALNLGWSVAELRGRLRYGHIVPPAPPGSIEYFPPAHGQSHALPLSAERSLIDRQIAIRVASGLLAQRFALDQPLPKRSEAASVTIRSLTLDLEKALSDAERNGHQVARADTYPAESAVAQVWAAIAEALYYWDAQIQDGLGVSAELLAGYQLGRGLSEAFWALDPDAPAPTAWPPDPSSWEFLLGPPRGQLLSDCMTRIEASLPPLSGPAVLGPLNTWCRLIADDQVRWRSQNAQDALRGQLKNWRDVLIEGVDPISSFATFTSPGLKLRRSFGFVLAMLPAVFLAAAGIALVTVAVVFFGSNTVNVGTAVLVAVAGTGTGLLGGARLREGRDAERRRVVAARATYLPRGAPRTPKEARGSPGP